ncbi:MAG: hypothetical protein HY654_00050 [Acidobacteria bacterium]|nr:hypothetical protein [Acidobacteriota bacterium]
MARLPCWTPALPEIRQFAAHLDERGKEFASLAAGGEMGWPGITLAIWRRSPGFLTGFR